MSLGLKSGLHLRKLSLTNWGAAKRNITCNTPFNSDFFPNFLSTNVLIRTNTVFGIKHNEKGSNWDYKLVLES